MGCSRGNIVLFALMVMGVDEASEMVSAGVSVADLAGNAETQCKATPAKLNIVERKAKESNMAKIVDGSIIELCISSFASMTNSVKGVIARVDLIYLELPLLLRKRGHRPKP